MMFRTNLGEMAPPHIWASRLSWELSGPTNLWISWLVRARYFSCMAWAHSSLVGVGGLVDIRDPLLWLMEKPSSDMMEQWRGGGYFSGGQPGPFYLPEGVVGDRL